MVKILLLLQTVWVLFYLIVIKGSLFQFIIYLSDTQFDSELDCQGLNCPLPILKTKKAMDGLTSGQILKMMATDPGSVNDVQSWTKRTGNPLMNHSEDNGVHSFMIQKK